LPLRRRASVMLNSSGCRTSTRVLVALSRLVAAILRLVAVPPLSVVVLSEQAFNAIPSLDTERTLDFKTAEGRKLEVETLTVGIRGSRQRSL
jgi:hypothetical protein